MSEMSTADVMRLAAEAQCDPRTVQAYLRGTPGKARVVARILEAASKLGLSVETKELSWVYFVQRLDRRIKIGFTSNPHVRLRTLAGEHGVLETLLLVTGARDEERLFHERFGTHRVEGEWFEPHEEVLSFIQGHLRLGVDLNEIPVVARQQFIFVPTARQAEAIRALTAERRAVDEHVSQGSVIRELVERGLDVLQASRSGGA